ncbi:MAG: glycosyltransferase family 4 protein [Candidatus Micrarchaeota archaeon]|nr:glycosyltransferase family 4 protein [Candidatus Micrarchaeota archaeon]
MFGWEFPPYNSGGLGTACEGLVKALAGENVRLILVLPKRLGQATPHAKLLFADVDKLVRVKAIATGLYPYILSGPGADQTGGGPPGLYGADLLGEVWAYAARARELVVGEDFDLIHAHDWLAFPAGVAVKALTGKPLVLHVHATEFDRTGGNGVNEEVYRIEKECLSLADRVIAVSRWTKDTLLKHYALPPEKIEVVHNGVDTDAFRPLAPTLTALKKAGAKIVLFVGRITLQKGPDYFIKAAKRVLEFEPDTYFVMAGSGDMLGASMNLAAATGVADRFLFPGFIRGEELNQVYQAADLFVLSSVSEPFGLTPLEALANGTPVLVSKQSGVAEVLEHALKVDFWDIDEMANKIVAALRHEPLLTALRQNGGWEIKKLSWPAAAKKCLNVYRSLLPAS